VAAAILALGLASAQPAGAHVLSKSSAKAAARNVAKSLAARGPTDASQPTFTSPACKRKSRHRFVCTTTVRGTSACDASETSCDGPAPWELSYAITVKLSSASATALSVTTTDA
jgi:hypothetical protein